MADKPPQVLSYGQFGRFSYSANTRELHSIRSSTAAYSAQVHTLRDHDETSGPLQPRHALTARSREKQIHELLRAYPELQPAAELLPELAQTSEAVELEADIYDPHKGSLLAVGSVPDAFRKHAVSVVAYAHGASGSDLRVCVIRHVRSGWSDSRDDYLRIPRLVGEEAVWRGPGAPIQQIVFANPVDGGQQYLAVRLLNSTVILKPTLAGMSQSGRSRLDLEFWAEITTEGTGGCSHVDVVFNQWCSFQCAIVDAVGCWFVWELSNHRSLHPAQLLDSGNLRQYKSQISEAKREYFWARISWVDMSTVVFCDQSSLRTHSFTGFGTSGTTVIHSFDKSRSEHYLDMIVLLQPLPHVVILTTKYINIYGINHGTRTALDCSMRIRHYLNSDDISLSLNHWSGTEESILFVSSAFTRMVSCYRIRFSNNSIARILDALELSIPLQQEARVKSLCFLPITYADLKEVNHSTASLCRQQGVQFIYVLVVLNDFTIKHTLYAIHNASKSAGRNLPPLSWEIKKKPYKSAAQVLDDDFEFIEDDRIDTSEQTQLQNQPVSAHVQRMLERNNPSQWRDWTLNLYHTAKKINKAEVDESISIEGVLEQTSSLLGGQASEDMPGYMPTMRDLMSGELSVRDTQHVDRLWSNLNSASASELASTNTGAEDHTRREMSIASAPSFLLPPGVTRSLTAVHEKLAAIWHSSLVEETSELARLVREQITYRVAAELYLAAHVLHPKEMATTVTEQTSQELLIPSSQVTDQWNLPIRLPTLSQQQDIVSSGLPTPSLSVPSRSITPSVTTTSSMQATLLTDEIKRLSRYTTFSKPLAYSLPRQMSRVLSHWTLGTDPDQYSWKDASRAVLEREQEIDGEELTEREREAIQRRAERYVRRQRREAAESQRQQILSSQVPDIISASQPRPEAGPSAYGMNLAPGSSHFFGSSQLMPASQILPGRHGGRPPVKKKRKLGF